MILEPQELWRTYPKDSRYEVSTFGGWKGVDETIRYADDSSTDYYRTSIGTIHRAVMITFQPYHLEDQLVVNHLDGDKRNNFIGNLNWSTSKDNNIHAWKTGLNHPAEGELSGKGGRATRRPVRVTNLNTNEVWEFASNKAAVQSKLFPNTALSRLNIKQGRLIVIVKHIKAEFIMEDK